MKKRLLAALLAFCMTVSLFPMQAMAAAAGNTSALGSLGIRQNLIHGLFDLPGCPGI